jgi:hypothetical protein
MKRLFVVIRSHGAAWQASRSIEGQEEWEAHASFMSALEKEGFICSADRWRARTRFFL